MKNKLQFVVLFLITFLPSYKVSAEDANITTSLSYTEIIWIISILVLFAICIRLFRSRKKFRNLNNQILSLSSISEEYLYHYQTNENKIRLMGKCSELLRKFKETKKYIHHNSIKVVNNYAGVFPLELKEALIGKENIEELCLHDENNNKRYFKIIKKIEIRDDKKTKDKFVIGKLVDITSEKNMVEDLQKSAQTDELTGLGNRAGYDFLLSKYGEHIPTTLTIFILDVNSLKSINDTLGHDAGDELIYGAADCIKKTFKNIGTCFRIGGDEFSVIAEIAIDKIPSICEKLEKNMNSWSGKKVKSLNIAYGYAAAIEYPGANLSFLAKIADTKMYERKEAYYLANGIDRRRQQETYNAICESYIKILLVNLTQDTYKIIKMNQIEETEEKGFTKSISKWLYNFGKSGQVHKDDLEEYLSHTNIDFLKNHLKENRCKFNIYYRRKNGDTFHKVMMEIIPTKEYKDDNQIAYIYVKDIDNNS